MKPGNAPIPPKLRMRPLDKRGYVVPYIATIDGEGRPHFTINDAAKVEKATRQRLCSLCGKKLEFDCWLVGGPGAAFHEGGAYLDPPMHHDCGAYALQVCPFLAAPSYSHRIDAKTFDVAKNAGMTILEETGTQPEQPDFFVFAKTSSVELVIQDNYPYLIPRRPWKAVEFWNDGKQITEEEARRLYDAKEQISGPRNELKWWS